MAADQDEDVDGGDEGEDEGDLEAVLGAAEGGGGLAGRVPVEGEEREGVGLSLHAVGRQEVGELLCFQPTRAPASTTHPANTRGLVLGAIALGFHSTSWESYVTNRALAHSGTGRKTGNTRRPRLGDTTLVLQLRSQTRPHRRGLGVLMPRKSTGDWDWEWRAHLWTQPGPAPFTPIAAGMHPHSPRPSTTMPQAT